MKFVHITQYHRFIAGLSESERAALKAAYENDAPIPDPIMKELTIAAEEYGIALSPEGFVTLGAALHLTEEEMFEHNRKQENKGEDTTRKVKKDIDVDEEEDEDLAQKAFMAEVQKAIQQLRAAKPFIVALAKEGGDVVGEITQAIFGTDLRKLALMQIESQLRMEKTVIGIGEAFAGWLKAQTTKKEVAVQKAR